MNKGSASRELVRGLCPVVVLVWTGAAHGAWELVPEVLLEAESNDNPRLRGDLAGIDDPSEDPATRILAEVRLEAANFTPRGELTIEPAVRSDAYADAADDELRSTDVYLRSTGRHDWQRANAGYALDLSREKILGAEFLAAVPDDIDVDDPTLVDGALVGLNERRTRVVLSPYTEIEAGTRSSVRLEGRFLDVGYDEDPLSARSDFADLLVGAEYIRRPSTRNTISGRVFASAFEADENRNETDTVGVEMRFSRSLSDIWSLNLALGLQKSEFAYLDALGAPVTGTDDNVSASVGFRKRAERTNLNLDLLRQISPDSFGFLAVRNQIRLTLLRRMSPTLDGVFAVRAIETDGLDGTLEADRSYGRIELGLDWAFTELWSLVAGYEHSSREIGFAEPDASSNAISVGVSYRGRTRR